MRKESRGFGIGFQELAAASVAEPGLRKKGYRIVAAAIVVVAFDWLVCEVR